MKYRSLSKTSLKVSEVGFPLGPLQAKGTKVSDQTFHHLLRYALDRGINFFDTADSDGEGRFEKLLGDALYQDRERTVIATKFGYNFYHGSPGLRPDRAKGRPQEPPQDFSPKYVKFACEESLKRLRTDHIDIYQIHHPRMTTVERDDLYAVLAKLCLEGKILFWGACLGPGAGWLEEGELLIRFRKVANVQMVYNIAEQEPGQELMGQGRKTGARFFVRSPQVKKMEKFSFFAGQGRTWDQAALKFVLTDPVVASVLPDIFGEDEINEFARVSECPDLTSKELEALRGQELPQTIAHPRGVPRYTSGV